MPSRWEQVVVAAEDPPRLARWWAEALGYLIVSEGPDQVEIRRTPSALPALLFTPITGVRAGMNRLHLDLRPDDQESEVERLVGMGARPVGIGHRDTGWVVLADPEGNEFRILSSGTGRSVHGSPQPPY
ncbi:hypothetical protein ACTI_33110 [Actinoplanes sp. OR16]|uniref:VOC family protein n=1 Tax=Actinoplanes sp. OR16 TaxID=946334 RepID=UPI000F714C8F|nr:VOC family protein [Actinoplanes sp. OR16]BBH66626.1 hypothetical protein ACTI_33110 [Actinoplanes sp. OR16]